MIPRIPRRARTVDDCASKPICRYQVEQVESSRPVPSTHSRLWVVVIVGAVALAIHSAPATVRAEGWTDLFQRPETPAPMYRETFDSDRLLWLLTGTLGTLACLVPGWALFHAGLTRRYQLHQILQRLLLAFTVLSLIWVLWVYSFCFAPRSSATAVVVAGSSGDPPESESTWIGGLDYLFLLETSSQLHTDRPGYPLRQPSDGVPHLLFIAFQLSWFAAATVPICFLFDRLYSGVSLWVSIVVWSTFVFAPLTHAVFGGGGLADVMDYGGVLAGHFGVGVSVLIVVRIANRRTSADAQVVPGPRPVLLGAGTLLIWIGTLTLLTTRAGFGEGAVANVLMGSHLAASAGVVGAVLIRCSRSERPAMSDLCRGALLGLVANTPAAGFVSPQSSMLIGLIATAAGYSVRPLLERGTRSSAVADAVMLHGFAAALGLMLTGVFATASVAGLDEDGLQINGLVAGDAGRLLIQLKALAQASLVAALGTVVVILFGNAASGISARRRLS